MADEPVSRILCRTQTGNRLACAAIIPLVPVSLPGSSSLPEGSHPRRLAPPQMERSEEHTSELQSHLNLVCRLLLEKKKDIYPTLHNIHVSTLPHTTDPS